MRHAIHHTHLHPLSTNTLWLFIFILDSRRFLLTCPVLFSSLVCCRAVDRWEEVGSMSYRPDGFTQDDRDLLQLMQEAACVRNSNR